MGDAEDYPETAEQLTSADGLPTQAAEQAELAWSRDDAETSLLRRPWRSAWSRAGLVVLCGIVVAIALGAIGWQVFRPHAAPPRPTTAPMSLTGKWSGPVAGDQTGFDVVADIVDGAQLNGTVSYPQLNCAGIWTQHGAAANGIRLITERITQGNCVPAEVTLTPQNDGTLYFTSTYYAASQQRHITIYATMRLAQLTGAEGGAPSVAVPAPNPTAAPPAIPPPAAPTTPAAPPAADPQTRSDDQRFLAMLSRDSIPPPTSPSDEVAAAADVCRMIKRGDDFDYVESFMVPPKGPFTQDQAEKFTADAISAYCPHAALG
jgi:hypothetical protein